MRSGCSKYSGSSMACIISSTLRYRSGTVHMTVCSSSQQFHTAKAEPDQIYLRELSHCCRQVVLTTWINMVVLIHNPHCFGSICEQVWHICVLRQLEINRYKLIEISSVVGVWSKTPSGCKRSVLQYDAPTRGQQGDREYYAPARHQYGDL